MSITIKLYRSTYCICIYTHHQHGGYSQGTERISEAAFFQYGAIPVEQVPQSIA